MRDFNVARFALFLSGFAALAPTACGGDDGFQGPAGSGGEAGTETGSTNEAGSGSHGGADPSVDGTGNGGVGSDTAGAAAAAGAANEDACKLDEDCGIASSACATVACIDGECVEGSLPAETACEGGACDGEGACVGSTCESGTKDGDETGEDCGGSCPLCADGEGCVQGTDCRSGVCTNQECQPSDCTDGVQNGSETDVDCGGSCAVKCENGDGCAIQADCAVTDGRGPESVRCLAQQCTDTTPPGVGIRYWQDFEPKRLEKALADEPCHATDDVCLDGNGNAYHMYGLTTAGAKTPLTKAKLFTAEGAVGSGGKFDGTYCLTRDGSNLALPNLGALTVMAWVKPTRNKAPWEGVIIGAPKHYMTAVDSNASSQRFLAAVATNTSTSFAYRNSTGTGEVVTGEWHHVAMTYDTSAAALVQYVDGTEVKSTTISGNVTTANADVFMGCRMDTALNQFFIGTLDEVVVYTRALSAAEVSDYVRRTQP